MEGEKNIDVYLLLFSGTLIFFLLASAVVLFIFLYRQRLSRQQATLQEMHTKLQLEILESNIEALETERKRFAEDLHDEIGSNLSALRLNLARLQKTSNDIALTQTLVNSSKEIIDTMIVMVRRVSHNLLPPSLESFGLNNAVEELCTWINTSSMLSVEMDYKLGSIGLEQKKQLAVYRIIQELFSNTIKHAQASHIYLSLIAFEKELQLVYRDDGKGLNLQQIPASAGLGFKNIENRVKMIKGKICYTENARGFECMIKFSAN